MEQNEFIEHLEVEGIRLSEKQVKQFELYYEQLVEWNKKMDLTTITDKKDVYLKHFFDSITPSFYYNFKDALSLCDVGAGAGFPSIPLKICFPNLKITIVDSLKKRMTFLNHLVEQLELDHVSVHHARAEDFARDKKNRESFDLVLARAVARTSVLSELCLPLCKKEGTFIALKGPGVENELDDARRAIKTLGGELSEEISLQLPIEQSDRTIVIIKKVKNTPKKYPRKAGTPQKNPIL